MSGVTCLPTVAHQLDGEVDANVFVVATAQHAQVILLQVRPRGPTFPFGILGFTDTDFGPDRFLLQKSLIDRASQVRGGDAARTEVGAGAAWRG